jgi:hypothetical protein
MQIGAVVCAFDLADLSALWDFFVELDQKIGIKRLYGIVSVGVIQNYRRAITA